MAIGRGDRREEAIAALATVHVGIEPVMLSLLAECGAITLADGGWLVGAGQIGMSGGALLCWRMAGAARPAVAIAAALVAIGAAAGLAVSGSVAAAVALRLLLGAAMGLLLAQANAAAARLRPHRAIGTIVLAQQLLSAIVMLALPAIAAAFDARVALAALVAVPVLMAVLLLAPARVLPAANPSEGPAGRIGRLSLPHLAGMVLLLAPTLMVWSTLGLAADRFGLAAHVAEAAIGAASLASIPAALIAIFHPPRAGAALTALGSGIAILAPILLPAGSPAAAFIGAMALFNAGSTYAVIRFTGWAMESCGRAAERRLVTVAQCLAMAVSGPAGALALAGGGIEGVAGGAVLCVLGAVVAPLVPVRSAAARLARA